MKESHFRSFDHLIPIRRWRAIGRVASILLAGAITACVTPARHVAEPVLVANTQSRQTRVLLGTSDTRWYLPAAAVDGRCMYAAPFRAGTDLEDYLRTSIAGLHRDSPPNVGVFPIDLDCFANVAPSELDRLSRARSARAAYIVLSLGWLRRAGQFEAQSRSEMASQLRLVEARRQRFGDPFLLLARKAAQEGSLACAGQLSGVAAGFGLVAAHLYWDQLSSVISSRTQQGVETAPCDDSYPL